jgi:hypothetical protein
LPKAKKKKASQRKTLDTKAVPSERPPVSPPGGDVKPSGTSSPQTPKSMRPERRVEGKSQHHRFSTSFLDRVEDDETMYSFDEVSMLDAPPVDSIQLSRELGLGVLDQEVERWTQSSIKSDHDLALGGFKAAKLVYKPTQYELDRKEMKKTTKAFDEAGFHMHVRDGGNDQANAHLMPALIPIPKAFLSDGSDALNSFVAEKAMERTRASLIDHISGYTKQQLLPLYVRNSQLESNGTSTFGDQTQEVLSKDRRYNHTFGRSFAVMETEEGGPVSLEARTRIALHNMKKTSSKKRNKRIDHSVEGINNAMVRMGFSK